MKTKLYILLFTISVNYSAFSQLGLSENRVIAEQGQFLKKEIDNSSTILYYKSKIVNDLGRETPEMIAYHIDRKNNICFMIIYSTTKNVTNSYIKLLNKMGVSKNDNTWINYNNNSIYTLKSDDEFILIEHKYITNELRSIQSYEEEIVELQKELNKSKSENEILINQVKSLKNNNQDLIKTMNELTVLSNKGVENIEKAAIIANKNFDKLNQLLLILKEKDKVILEYIEKLKNKCKD